MPDTLSRGLHEAVERAMTVGDPFQRRERVHAAIAAHLDALTAAVDKLRYPPYDESNDETKGWNDAVAAVLAMLRGEQQ